jgi:hypothetical protein
MLNFTGVFDCEYGLTDRAYKEANRDRDNLQITSPDNPNSPNQNRIREDALVYLHSAFGYQ